MKAIDLTGRKFGRLEVIKEAPKIPGNKNRRWLCRCKCGKETIVFGHNLKSGHAKSCGCALKEYDIAKNTIHGKRYHRLYNIWCKIKERCHNPNSKAYSRYGGRGIKLCQEWDENFENFYIWACENGYNTNLTIDRIDNNQGYSPDNCRWATTKTQNNNTSQNRYFTVNEKTMTQRQWEELLGLPRGKLWKIRNSGKNVEEYIAKRLEDYHDKFSE